MHCRENKGVLDPYCKFIDLVIEKTTVDKAASSQTNGEWEVEIIKRPSIYTDTFQIPTLQKKLFGDLQPLVQKDDYSCGVLVCWYIRQIMREESLGEFPKDKEGNLLLANIRSNFIVEILLALQRKSLA